MEFARLAAHVGLHADSITVTPLTGGVSSDIHLLDDGAARVVVKRAIPKLRVKEDWPARPSRIWSEAEALRSLGSWLETDSVPRIYHEDRESYSLVMSAAPEGVETWKSRLLAGKVDLSVATSLGRLHRAFLEFPDAAAKFADQSDFEDLRIAPYYAFTRDRYPDLAGAFDRAIEAARQNRRGLVHGDFSPKNILVGSDSFLWALDWECVHYGDPAFDSGFILNHLILKAFHRPELRPELSLCATAYHLEVAPLVPWRDTLVHLPLLMLARMDGKSPVEYITQPEHQNRIRSFAVDLLSDPPVDLAALFQRLS